MSDMQLSPDLILEETKSIYGTLIGDLMQQIAIQRTINRQQEQIIASLRKTNEELTNKE